MKRVNFALLFLLSLFLPGVSYMYMGLIKRGLAAMCGFFLLIYLTVTAFWPLSLLFGLALPVVYIVCFFDGFRIALRINAGEEVEDGVGDVLNGLLRNKKLTMILLIIIGLAFAGNIFSFAVNLVRRAVPVLVIALALYIILKKPPKE